MYIVSDITRGRYSRLNITDLVHHCSAMSQTYNVTSVMLSFANNDCAVTNTIASALTECSGGLDRLTSSVAHQVQWEIIMLC